MQIQQIELSKVSTPGWRPTVTPLKIAGKNPFPACWDFLSSAAWTRDEASGRIRKFPALTAEEIRRGPTPDNAEMFTNGEYRFEYLKRITEHRRDNKIALYEKSRRMLVTWWALAVYLHDTMTQPNHLNFVMSDKLEKSAYLLGPDRMQFIYDHIPPVNPEILRSLKMQGMDTTPLEADIWPDKPEVIFERKNKLGWEIARCPATNSTLMGIAQGASQLQQYTASNILMDEFPRWEWQEESWRNIQPTTQGGGHVDIICTAELGVYAYDLAYDRVA